MTDRRHPDQIANAEDAAKQQKTAGRRLEWPTLWHPDQLAFPWGGAKRLRKRPQKAAQADAERKA